jgi:hypothetical protein
MPKRPFRFLPVFPVHFVAFVLFASLAAGCTRSPARVLTAPPATAAAPAFVTAPAEEAIPQLIAAEREASRTGDLALLAQLWAEDARIVDTRGTEDTADDFVWPNRAAILDRYKVAVFPAPPPGLNVMLQLDIEVAEDVAQALNDNDRWQFTQREGRWWITALSY